jgi:hypothetical protein
MFQHAQAMTSNKQGPWKELLAAMKFDVKSPELIQLIPIEVQQALTNSQSKKR